MLVNVDKGSWSRGEVTFSYFAFDMLEKSRKRRHYIETWQTHFADDNKTPFQPKLERLLAACEAWLSLTMIPEVRNESTARFYDSFRKEHECWQTIAQRTVMTFTDRPFVTGRTPTNWNFRTFLQDVEIKQVSYARNFLVHASIVGLVDLLKTNEVIWAKEATTEPWFLLDATLLIMNDGKEPDVTSRFIIYDGNDHFATVGTSEHVSGRLFVQEDKTNIVFNLLDKTLMQEVVRHWLGMVETAKDA
jgi:hypothetical protein